MSDTPDGLLRKFKAINQTLLKVILAPFPPQRLLLNAQNHMGDGTLVTDETPSGKELVVCIEQILQHGLKSRM